MRFHPRLLSLPVFGLVAALASAQHLIWRPATHTKPYTCLYGEVTVLVTSPTIYYCGCNWWPGNPAGGYTGIQDPGGGRHNMIFSIWDTSPTLHPTVTEADERTKYNRFGGEGTGAHTHLDYNWKVGSTYRYYATKTQDAESKNTLTKLYFYDETERRWVHEATISNPNDGHESVTSFGGMLNAFLENWSGADKAAPKPAEYRLWLGTSPRDLENVTEASGDGLYGVLNDTFFLAGGDKDAVDAAIQKAEERGGKPQFGASRRDRLQVSRRTVPRGTVRELEHLRNAPAVTAAR